MLIQSQDLGGRLELGRQDCEGSQLCLLSYHKIVVKRKGIPQPFRLGVVPDRIVQHRDAAGHDPVLIDPFARAVQVHRPLLSLIRLILMLHEQTNL